MLRTIYLHGELGQKFGKSHTFDVANMFQVMAALKSRFGAEFKNIIRSGNWSVLDGPMVKGNDLAESDLDKRLKNSEVHILPETQGASSAFRLIVGAVLIVAGVVTKQMWMVNIGASMVIGGVAEMLMRPPTLDQRKAVDEGKGSLFATAKNITMQGGALPVVYGRVTRASSYVISSDFSSERE